MINNNDKYSVDIDKCQIGQVYDLINEHLKLFPYGMDSWPEERLVETDKYIIKFNGEKAGYAAIKDNSIFYFYISGKYFKYASFILEEVVNQKEIKSVFILTQDSLLSALIAEWDFKKIKLGCGFSDNKENELPVNLILDKNEEFRQALITDCEEIRKMSGDFFDEPGAGYSNLEERVEAGNIFVLTFENQVVGGGIMERSSLFKDTVSIGMYTSSSYRKKGAARKVILYLKKQAYLKNLRPVAGCWYYNTLSRKSLEASGMVVTTICYEAILLGKEVLPKRTGNPPGELVE